MGKITFWLGVAFVVLSSMYSILVNSNDIHIHYYLDALVVSSLILSKKLTNNKEFTLLLILSLYICISLILSQYYIGNYLKDYVVAYKSYIYLLIILITHKKLNFIDFKRFYILYRIVLYSIFIKYLLSVFYFGVNRPRLIWENNFELMMLFILTVGLYNAYGRIKNYELLLLFSVSAMSGSKSAMAIYLFLLILYLYDYKQFGFKAYVLTGVGLFSLYISLSSIGSFYSIDRVVFFLEFIKNVNDWNFLNYIFGTFPLTPLAESTCRNLSFFESMFSDDGKCYSVVFHSLILRQIYDHGLLFTLMLVLGYHNLFKKHLSKKSSLAITSIALLNSLSVSSYNSIFFIFPVVIVLSLFHEKRKH